MPPFAARLWPDKPPTNLLTPSPQIKGKAVTVSSQLLRSLRLLHNCQLTVLVYPPPPPGAIIAREPQCRRERQCPESAYINIIPSGLCNKSARAPLVSASHTIRIMLSTLRQRVANVLPSNSRARRRQESRSLREGTTPPLRRSLRTSRNLRFSVIKVRVPLQQSSLREGARDHCFRYEARNEGIEVCVGGKCRPEDRQCRATGISRLQRLRYASILPPYAASAAGSFQAVTPLPPQAPSEESRPSTPR